MMPKAKARTSNLWNYFDVLDEEERKALCRSCSKTISYKGSISNLKLHLKKKHPSVLQNFLIENDLQKKTYIIDEEDEGDDQLPSTSLSGVFRAAGSGARCTLCGERVGRREHDLRDHLHTCHSKIVEEIEDSNSPDRNPLRDLDDGELIRRLRGSPSPPRRKSRSSYRREERRKSPESDDEVASFLVYLGTLLRTVPRENSARLQADIVSLVASSRAEYEKKKAAAAAKVVSTPKYIITIPSTSQGVPGGVKEIVITNEDQEKVQEELVTLIRTQDQGMEGTDQVTQEVIDNHEVSGSQGESGTDVHME